MDKMREWVSIRIAKSPGQIILLGVVFANIIFIAVASMVLSYLAPESLENSGFWEIVFYTITMILGVGGVENVVEEIGQADILYVVACLSAIIIGMIVFTGAIIGYISEWIAGFFEDADEGARPLYLSGHIVILNWNSRAAEIINELLYKQSDEKVVVLVSSGREEVKDDIEERLSDTVDLENEELAEACQAFPFWRRFIYMRQHRLKNKLTVIVRQGDPWSVMHLQDISTYKARTVIILNNAEENPSLGNAAEAKRERSRGNLPLIKTLVQVAELTRDEDSMSGQQIIVEIEDEWTMSLVETIIQHKMRKDKCTIVPLAANRILGQIFSQFTIMPELNTVFATLFSNKGAAFFVESDDKASLRGNDFVSGYLKGHLHAVPLLQTVDEENDKTYRYYMAEKEADILRPEQLHTEDALTVELNPDAGMSAKRILVLGHNTKSSSIMEGFELFRNEWQKPGDPEILNVTVIDDAESVAAFDYRQYSCVQRQIEADVYDMRFVCGIIEEIVSQTTEDLSILILSDDTVDDDEIDANALTYLILVQDIIGKLSKEDPEFAAERISLIVEILNPKNYNIVHSYSTDNIVISNRFLSKLMIQIGDKEALFDFFDDILSYDTEEEGTLDSKELYIKEAEDFFTEIPPASSAAQLIRAVYQASPEENKIIVLGYINDEAEVILFAGDQTAHKVELSVDSKLIVYCAH